MKYKLTTYKVGKQTSYMCVCVLLTLLLVADVNTTLHIVALQRLALLQQHWTHLLQQQYNCNQWAVQQ